MECKLGPGLLLCSVLPHIKDESQRAVGPQDESLLREYGAVCTRGRPERGADGEWGGGWRKLVRFFLFFFDLFIYPEESRYMMNGFRLSPAVGLAFP